MFLFLIFFVARWMLISDLKTSMFLCHDTRPECLWWNPCHNLTYQNVWCNALGDEYTPILINTYRYVISGLSLIIYPVGFGDDWHTDAYHAWFAVYYGD